MLLLPGMGCKPGANGGNTALTTQQIASKALPAVVTVTAQDEDGGKIATGSGFFIEPDTVVTNVHVIAGAADLYVTLSDKRRIKVSAVRATDSKRDLALLRCTVTPAPPSLSLAPGSEKLETGETVVAAGSPLGLEGSITSGIVSAVREEDGIRVVQVTAPISPGSSGGPLLNARGEVIGVNSFTASRGQNVNFAYASSHIADLLSGKTEKPGTDTASAGKEIPADPNRDTILSLLAQPAFSGTEFAKQALDSPARLELLATDTGQVYFSLPSSAVKEKDLSASVQRTVGFIEDFSQVMLAKAEGKDWQIDGLSVPRSPERGAVFVTPMANIRFPLGKVFRFPYKRAAYSLNTDELKAYWENSVIYGGMINADTRMYYDTLGEESMPNRGAFVAKPGEPSLKRLASELTGKATDAQKIQRLTDFVAREIEEDYSEASQAGDVLKRPCDVLMTRKASRGNKVVLLASLLEQVGSDYLLVYSPRRVWVAVPQKLFPATNKLALDWEGKRWTLIDVSQPDFRIGETKLTDPPALKDLMFVQRPRKPEVIVDRVAGQALGFL
jgi:hypothetical protein